MASKWRAWIVDRFGLKPIYDEGLDRRVPKSPWYFGDGATLLMLLGIQVVTGMFMTLTYAPSPEAAYDSVVYITHQQSLGWFVRALHYWGAGLMVLMIAWHPLRQVLIGGYKAPREGTWLVGVALFFAVLVMGFTGYTLRWDERAVAAIHVVLHLFSRVPLIGDLLVRFVQGGTELSALTLTRLYAVHVVFTPLLLLGLAAYHVYLVILKGTTAPDEFDQAIRSSEEQKRVYEAQAHSERGETFFPETWLRSGRFGLAVLLLLMGLAILVGPQELYPEANLTEPSVPQEEWWFWWYSALIAVAPRVAPVVAVALPVALFLAMLLLPFLDRSPYRGMKKRPFAVAFVVAVTLAVLYLTTLRYTSDWTGWPGGDAPPVPEGVALGAEAEEGRLLFGAYGCISCHAIAGYGPRIGPDLARMGDRLSIEHIRRYVLEPPEGVAMPSYAGRMTEDELQKVVDFVHVAQTFPRSQGRPSPDVEWTE